MPPTVRHRTPGAGRHDALRCVEADLAPFLGFEAIRGGNFDVVLEANCQSVVNPLLDVGKYLPHTVFTENYGNYEDQKEIDLYEQMLHETDPAKTARLDARIREIRGRRPGARSYMKGWKVGPSHFNNQDLATIWLDK